MKLQHNRKMIREVAYCNRWIMYFTPKVCKYIRLSINVAVTSVTRAGQLIELAKKEEFMLKVLSRFIV